MSILKERQPTSMRAGIDSENERDDKMSLLALLNITAVINLVSGVGLVHATLGIDPDCDGKFNMGPLDGVELIPCLPSTHAPCTET